MIIHPADRTYGHCNYVTEHQATIFYDELSSQYELINYSRHGTRVDECLYTLDTACVSTRYRSFADPDPGSGAFLNPGSGMGKKSGSGSGMTNLDHISENFETIFWAKILKFFDAYLGSGMEKIRIRDPEKHPGSATLRYKQYSSPKGVRKWVESIR
jgi:hypothetical protein